jgi:hypothetical protein
MTKKLRAHSASPAREASGDKQNPATTKKYQAYVKKRRGEMESKKMEEEEKV